MRALNIGFLIAFIYKKWTKCLFQISLKQKNSTDFYDYSIDNYWEKMYNMLVKRKTK